MDRREYLKALGEALATLVPDRERREILRYYEEYFAEAGPEREAELIQELGLPEALAEKIAREGGFSGGEEERRTPVRGGQRKWIAGIVVAVLLVAGVFAAVSALNGRPTAQVGEPSRPDTVYSSDPILSDAPASPLPGTESPPSGEEQQSNQGQMVLDGTFVRLNVNIALGNIAVYPGDDFGLTLKSSGRDRYGEEYQLHYTLKDGMLSVWSTPEELQTDGQSDIQGEVTVTVPWDWNLEKLEVENVAGDIGVMEVTADEVSAKSTSGGVRVENLAADSVHLTSVSGDLSLGCLDAFQSVELGSVSGDVIFRGPLSPVMQLGSTSGDIKVIADNTPEECAYTLNCISGKIRIDGVSFEPPCRKGSGQLSLAGNTISGDITVEFNGSRPENLE